MQFPKTKAYVAALCSSIVLSGCGDSGSENPDPGAAGSNASGGGTGGSSSLAGASSTGGQTTPAAGSGPSAAGAGGMVAAAGSPTAGAPTTAGSGGTSAGGSSASGGTAGNGTAGSGTGGQSGDKWGGLKNPPIKSAGCGKPAGITTGMKTIMSGGKSRDYSIDVPATYNQNAPHRVVFIYHWSGGSAASMKNNRYYNIQPLATAANIPTIFIAPTHGASEADHTVFLDLLAYAETNLCVDSTRVFSTGYSLGGMMTYSLSTKQQTKLRAGAGIAAANFNVWLPNPKNKESIAYMGITGMQDELCIWDGGSGRGAKYIALEKAANNGCTVGTDVPHWTSGNHFTYEYLGCKPGYPVVISTFQGKHGGAEVAKDPGASSSWVPKEIWEFFMRF
jgi:poly(3-hydroxybutyrate) depolymerase